MNSRPERRAGVILQIHGDGQEGGGQVGVGAVTVARSLGPAEGRPGASETRLTAG